MDSLWHSPISLKLGFLWVPLLIFLLLGFLFLHHYVLVLAVSLDHPLEHRPVVVDLLLRFPQLPDDIPNLGDIEGHHYATEDLNERNDDRLSWVGGKEISKPNRHHDGGAPIVRIDILMEPSPFE